MDKFEVSILGCGSALPTTRHFSTSQVVNVREKLFMIDCGEGAQIQLRRLRLKFKRLNHVFISHLHGDHCFGLMGLISTFGMLRKTGELHIHAPEGLQELLTPQIDYFCQGISFKVVFHVIDPWGVHCIYEDRSLRVRTIPLKHRMPCCGFLFEEIPTPHQIASGIAPRKYAYCSDTICLPKIVPLIKDVDLLFHEATFAEKDLPRARETFHTTAKQAAEIAQMANARQLLIGHFSARYDDENLLLDEAKTIFPNTLLAYEGQKIELLPLNLPKE